MRKLNDLSESMFKLTANCRNNTLKNQCLNGKSIFVPELIDLICPKVYPDKKDKKKATRRPVTQGKCEVGDSMVISGQSELQSKDIVNLNQICIVTEIMEQNLDQMLRRNIIFSETNLIKIVYNSLCSLAFLHEANVMHRNFQPKGIQINSNCNAKIVDFSLARTIP